MKKSDYIAVFDSGLGGLSVLRELQALMPNERFLYYGDRKNAPYGIKTTEEVRRLTLEAAAKLMNKGCKALVVACNTATAAAIATLRETYPHKVIVGIEPALKPAAEAFPSGPIGIMAGAVCKFAGARNVVITDINDDRLALAQKKFCIISKTLIQIALRCV